MKKCPPSLSLLDYSALVVGYGTEDSNDFWILKFSWSTSWGENGYIRLARNSNGAGVCGIGLDSGKITFSSEDFIN